MTEAEWLACKDPLRMLLGLRDRAGDRKMRLFAVACCRLMDRRGNTSGLAALELAERVADGLLPLAEAQKFEGPIRRLLADSRSLDPAPFYIYTALWFTQDTRPWAGIDRVALLRDIFGNPFRPVSFDLTWRTPTARKLAQAVYDTRRFEDLPILADALEEAGCTDAEVLAHCRGGGDHVRGCWVVDLVLGRE
jgi:hypothetical protein